MTKIYKVKHEIKLRNGDEIQTAVRESEYSWSNHLDITADEVLTDLPKELNLGTGDEKTLIIKPSDILYIIKHKEVIETEDDDSEE